MTTSPNKMSEPCKRAEQKSESMGYVAHMNWLELMCRRYDQKQCDKCGKWHIFKLKVSPAELREKVGRDHTK